MAKVKNNRNPKSGVQIQDLRTLKSEFLVYQCSLDYDDLVDLAKRKGIRSIRNTKTTND
ncbi:MAG: hypothetical protein ACLP5H_17305 [Desulfomonilaceae bacterium]